MIKDFLLTRTASDVPMEKLQCYLQFTHAPLALSVAALVRETSRYTMNHAISIGADACRYQPIPQLATVVEHDFGGWEGIMRFSADADYLAVVRPDEQFMVQRLMDGAPQFVAIEEEIAVFGSAGTGKLRMFDFVRRPQDITRAEFLDGLAWDASSAITNDRYRAAVSGRVHSIVGEGTASFGADAEPFDAVIETWIDDPAALAALRIEAACQSSDFCDPARSFSAITEENWICGAADAFGPRAETLTSQVSA